MTPSSFIGGPLSGGVYTRTAGRRPTYLDEDARTIPVAQGDRARWHRGRRSRLVECYVMQADGHYHWTRF